MKGMLRQGWTGVLMMAVLATAWPAAAREETEDQLIQDLAATNPGKVTDALQELQEKFPASTRAFAAEEKLLTDSRARVRRKAARVLGVLHADVSAADKQAISLLLKSYDANEIMDGLKALRGLKAPECVPDMLPLLKHDNSHVVRDACRTLAVLGTKDTVAALQPLLNSPDPAVKKDAQDAIFILQAKP